MNFEEIVTQRVTLALSKIGNVDLSDPSMCSAISSTLFMELVDIQDDYPEFDAKAEFDFDNEQATVEWWIGLHGKHNEFIVKFNPLRIEYGMRELIDAYDHAMSIL